MTKKSRDHRRSKSVGTAAGSPRASNGSTTRRSQLPQKRTATKGASPSTPDLTRSSLPNEQEKPDSSTLLATLIALLTLIAATAVVTQALVRALLSLVTLLVAFALLLQAWHKYKGWPRSGAAACIVIVILVTSDLGVTAGRDAFASWNAPHAPTTAEADTDRLNKLHPGELLSAFEATLATSAVAVIRRGVDATAVAEGAKLDDRLYLLSTTYIEAFVDETRSTVVGYTITARTGAYPKGLILRGASFDLGRTNLGKSPFTVARVASVCNNHINALYEISDTSEADLSESVAMGETDSGAEPPSGASSCSIDAAAEALPTTEGQDGADSNGEYVIEEHAVTQEYLQNTLATRSRIPINTVTVTAPDWPVLPVMISLHLEDIETLGGGR